MDEVINTFEYLNLRVWERGGVEIIMFNFIGVSLKKVPFPFYKLEESHHAAPAVALASAIEFSVKWLP